MLSLRSVTVSAPSTARRRPPLARLPRTSVVDLGAVAVPQTPRTITTADLHMHQLTSMRDTVRRDQDRSDLATYGTVYVGAIDRESISRVSSRLSMHGGQTPTFTPRPIPEPITSLVIGGALRAIKSAPKPPRASVIGPKPSVPVRRAILRGFRGNAKPPPRMPRIAADDAAEADEPDTARSTQSTVALQLAVEEAVPSLGLRPKRGQRVLPPEQEPFLRYVRSLNVNVPVI
eukprot:TRINITY_DN7536_c0_g1_i3.p1 TRINITY_DN7536_c0_g1~~TRINITY_DN7536_c0_g1_i3.p1  ORF type:complete len:232 (-),score=28.85 TRINITY_DN7536_c0_g1_i3:186-881(-)